MASKSADFSKILNKKPEDIEKPKPLPPGEYRAVITSVELDESAQKKTPFARFSYNLIEALDSVDPDLLAQAGGIRKKDGEPRSMSRDDYYITEDSTWRLKEYFNSMFGENNWESLAWGIENANGQEVILTLHEETYTPKNSTKEETAIKIKSSIGTYEG